MYLLDTNYCSRIIQGEASTLARFQALRDVQVVTSAIVRGELVFMVENSQQRIDNRARLNLFFRDIDVYSIDTQASDIYGQLKAGILRHFGPREKVKRSRVTVQQLGFGDNDLWIAATALQHNLTVVSRDSDFVRIQQVQPLLLESW